MQALKHGRKLNRALTRDLPLFVVMSSYDTHLNERVTQKLGYPLSRNFVLFDRGAAEIHRDNQEWYEDMPIAWRSSINNPNGLAAIQQFINDTQMAIDGLQTTKAEPSVNYLQTLADLIKLGVPGMIFAHWVPIHHELNLVAYEPDTLAYFRQSRQKIEKFFSLAGDKGYELITMLGERHNADTALLKYATIQELVDFITTDKLPESLRIRQQNQLLFLEGELLIGATVYQQFLESQGYWLEQPRLQLTNPIKGTPACKGIVSGEAQIITCRQQFGNFKPGNILVAPMTTPEYMPLINIASALITDEGGMLSHAAIVSRELSKPCIVGTHDASYILEDFQKVEVNADRGLVTVL